MDCDAQLAAGNSDGGCPGVNVPGVICLREFPREMYGKTPAGGGGEMSATRAGLQVYTFRGYDLCYPG